MTQSPELNIYCNVEDTYGSNAPLTGIGSVSLIIKCCLRYVTEPISIFISRKSDAESPDILIDNRKHISNFKVLQ